MTTGCALTLLFVILSIRVTLGRAKTDISLGIGQQMNIESGQKPDPGGLLVRTRTQANFAEYVPLSLILLGLTEWAGGKPIIVDVLAAMLIIARLVHPFGMSLKAPNPLRAGSIILQWLMLVATSIYGLFLGTG
jgi:uncharacterized membrane protein YecN with MAPEG domain